MNPSWNEDGDAAMKAEHTIGCVDLHRKSKDLDWQGRKKVGCRRRLEKLERGGSIKLERDRFVREKSVQIVQL